jgi:hypothetical protein
MVPLLDTLIKKTRYHSNKLGKKFKGQFGPYKNLGQFRLNVVARQQTIRLRPRQRSNSVNSLGPQPPPPAFVVAQLTGNAGGICSFSAVLATRSDVVSPPVTL